MYGNGLALRIRFATDSFSGDQVWSFSHIEV